MWQKLQFACPLWLRLSYTFLPSILSVSGLSFLSDFFCPEHRRALAFILPLPVLLSLESAPVRQNNSLFFPLHVTSSISSFFIFIFTPLTSPHCFQCPETKSREPDTGLRIWRLLYNKFGISSLIFPMLWWLWYFDTFVKRFFMI